MPDETSVGTIYLDLVVKDQVEAQVKNAVARSKPAFSDASKTISASLEKPLQNASKIMQAPLEQAKKKTAQTAEEIRKIAERAVARDVQAQNAMRSQVETPRVAQPTKSDIAFHLVDPPKVDTKSMDEADAKAKKLASSFKLAETPLDSLNQKLDIVNAQIGEQQRKLQEAYKQYINISSASGSQSEAALKADAEISQIQARINSLQSTAIQTQTKIDKAVQSTAQKASSTTNKTVSHIKKSVGATTDYLKSQTSNAVKHVKKQSGVVGKSFTQLGKTVRSAFKSVFIFSTLYAIFRSLKTAVGSATKENKKFQESLNSLKASLQVLAQPIMNILVPAITYVMQGLATVAQTTAAFVSSLFGKTYQEALAAQKQLTKTQDVAEKSYLASFDQVNTRGTSDEESSIDYDVASEVDTSGAENAAGKLKEVFAKISGWAKKAFAPSTDSWGKAFASLKKPVKDAFESVKASTSDLWNKSLVPFGSYLANDFIPGIANDFSVNLAPIFSDVMSVAIKEWAKDFDFACKNIKRIIDDVLIPAFQFISTVWAGVTDGLKKAWDSTGASILAGFEEFKESLREIYAAFPEPFREAHPCH